MSPLDYPKRRYGMDQDRYDWRPGPARAPSAWPGGRKVAALIVSPLEFHRLDPVGKPFKAPGAMQTPYPDLRHYTQRDYGLRVGAFRILDELDRAGLKATFAVNAILLERVPPLIEAIRAAGHEIAAHGWEADALHWGGLAREAEAGLIARTRAAFDAHGLSPRAWLSPARSESFATPDLIAAAGFDICLDWEMDASPLPIRTSSGPVCCVPLMNELDDRKLLIDQRHSEAQWRDQILEAAAFLASDQAGAGGNVLSFTLTPYVSGQPFRIRALREILAALARDPQVWNASVTDIADAASRQ